jgi:mono/diheme cytochrome c family protein
MLWDEALAPSEEMHPGRACIQCHIDENSASGEGDAPIFGAAGTVFPSAHEPDDCLATSTAGAIVTLTDATGTRYPLEVSVNGNFLVEDPAFLAPYIAEISFEGRVRSMVGAQTNGDCNACHTADGDHDAPGRIALP